jgi:hypothetical protein
VNTIAALLMPRARICGWEPSLCDASSLLQCKNDVSPRNQDVFTLHKRFRFVVRDAFHARNGEKSVLHIKEIRNL